MANPEFDKIRENNFKKYYYEPFTKTLKRNPSTENSFKMWEDDIKEFNKIKPN